MLRTPAFIVGITLVLGALAVVIAAMLGAPAGPDHSCPGGAPASACHYPPDTTAWLLGWAVGGIVSGLTLGSLIAVTLGRDRPHAKPQRHLLRQSR